MIESGANINETGLGSKKNVNFPMEWLMKPWDKEHDPKFVKAYMKRNEIQGFPVSQEEIIEVLEKYKKINVMEDVFGGLAKNKDILNVMFGNEVQK